MNLLTIRLSKKYVYFDFQINTHIQYSTVALNYIILSLSNDISDFLSCKNELQSILGMNTDSESLY